MASFVMNNAEVFIATVDLSVHVKSVTLDTGVNLTDDTAMGDTFVSNAAGLRTWSMSVEFLQDYAASKVDATMNTLLDIGDTVAVTVKPVKGTSTSATNPKYSGTAICESYNPIGGSVGDQAMATASFVSASALTRLTE